MVRVAPRDPAADGVKIKLTVQVFPAATAAVVLHVELDCIAKSFAAAPEMAMALMVSDALPLLVNVTVEADEPVPTLSAPNVGVIAPRVTSAATPVPVRATV